MNTRRSVAALSAAIAVVLGAGGVAAADPVDPPTPSQSQVDRAKAAVAATTAQQRALEARLDAAQTKLDAVNAAAELAGEKYNESRAVLAQRVAAAKTARAAAESARKAALAAQSDVDHLAASVYMQGGSLDGLESLVQGLRFGDLARQAADVASVGDFRRTSLDEAQRAAALAQTTKRTAAQAELQQSAAAARARTTLVAATAAAKAAASQAATLTAQRTALVAELATLRRTSAAVEQARIDGLAAAAAQRAADQRAQASANAAAAPVGPLPAADSAAANTAITYAKAQIGKPYLWAAEGPNSFDCSGLTMKAWAAAGVTMGHYTGWQWQQTARVSLNQLKPGDLVFFGADVPSIHHVGLYVGNGMMIEAPHSGAQVRYATIYRSGLLPYGGRPHA